MTIVWGHNHFRIKSVEPHEVGLHDAAFKNIKFDLQQKYGHLFWIPFIPLGKVWTVNKGDGKKYVCHPDLERLLNQHPGGTSSKYSIFAWSGFLLIFLVCIIVSVSEKVTAAQNRKYAEERVKESYDALSARLDNVKEKDYLVFTVKQDGRSYSFGDKYPMKVMNRRDDELLLGYFSEISEKGLSDTDDVKFNEYLHHHRLLDSFWIKKSLVKQGILPDRYDNGSFEGIILRDYYANGRMQLEGIKYIPGGPLPVDDPAAPGRSESYYELVNHGEDVHADSLVALNAGISCQLSKQRNFKNGDRIAVKLFGDNGVYFLYCSDKFNQVYRYKLSKRKIDMGDLVHFVLSVDRADF